MASTTSTSQTRPLIGIALVITGVALMTCGFVAAIEAALDGGGDGPGFFVTVCFAGGALVVATAVLAVVGLCRGDRAISR